MVSEKSEKELSQFEKLSAYCDTKDMQRKEEGSEEAREEVSRRFSIWTGV